MLTTMTESDWAILLRVLRASRSRRGDKGRDDRKFSGGTAVFCGPQHQSIPIPRHPAWTDTRLPAWL
jgi:hypothetical protein